MDRIVSIVSACFLVFLLSFLWGWLSPVYKIFPYQYIQSVVNEISAFVAGGEGDHDLTAAERLENDAGGTPYRQLVKVEPVRRFTGREGLQSKYDVTETTGEIYFSPGREGTGFTPSFLSYGPYIFLVAGDYEISFMLSVDAPPNREIGFLDAVYTHEGEQKVIRKIPLMGTDGKNRAVSYRVSLAADRNMVEFRVFLGQPFAARVKSLAVTRQQDWYKKRFVPIEFAARNPRRQNPEIYRTRETLFDEGYLFIFGAMDSGKSLHGGILLDRFGNIVHSIDVSDDSIKKKIEEYNRTHTEKYKFHPMQTRFPHGVVILRDGSVIFNDGDAGNSIRRIDWNGREIWSRLLRSHHAMELDLDNNLVWHLEVSGIMATDIETGETRKNIRLTDVVAANRQEGGLDIRRDIMAGKDLNDRFHWNDVEPLPAALSDKFPQFATGDLLLSFRSLDLVTVIDPETYKMKWWRIGATKRQHDPDWQPDGTITVFDNQMGDTASRIVAIDPVDYRSEVIYSGVRDQAYTWMRGKHQVLPNGSILMTFPQQGRVLLVEPDGAVRFDFINKFDDKNNLLVSEAIYLPPGYFDSEIEDELSR